MFGGVYFGQPYFGQGYPVPGILFDNSSSSGYEASLSTYSWSHTCAGPLRGLIVNVSIFLTGQVASITYGGVNMVFEQANTIGVYRNEMWSLPAPAYGSNTVTVTLNTSVTSIASASSYNNVDQYDCVESSNGSTGSGVSTPSVTATTIDNNAWVVSGLTTSNTSMTVAGGATQRTNNTGALGTGAMSDIGPVTPAGTQVMSWSAVGSLDSWAIGEVVLDPYIDRVLLPNPGIVRLQAVNRSGTY
jgi:hypothetical protein